MCLGNKTRHNHPFIIYIDGHVKASKLPGDLREHIREFSATDMQLAYIMTSIWQNYLEFMLV